MSEHALETQDLLGGDLTFVAASLQLRLATRPNCQRTGTDFCRTGRLELLPLGTLETIGIEPTTSAVQGRRSPS